MIFTERTITVVNNSATINKPLILYRGDKNIELKITIAESQFKFRNTDASNVIETTDASYAQLVINTPYNSPIFSDVAVTKNGAVIFVITEAMIDEIREVGAYEIQIRLLDDNKQSRASIPPVSNAIEIREPIAIEDGSAVDSNAVNVAKVNRALTTTSAPLEAFDSQGNYIKKTWGDGDPITDAALNKMEAGIDGVNKKVANVSSQIKDIENQKADKKDVGAPTQEQVNSWLNEHPEATTTVQDNSIEIKHIKGHTGHGASSSISYTNLFDSSNYNDNKYYSGTSLVDNTEYLGTNFINCVKGDNIYIRYGDNLEIIKCYGVIERRTSIDSLTVTSFSSGGYSITKDDANSVILFFKKTDVVDINKLIITKNEIPTAPTDESTSDNYDASCLIPLTVKRVEQLEKKTENLSSLNIQSRWKNKKVLIFGDSISADDTCTAFNYGNYTKWPTHYKTKTGCELYNYSHHGFGYFCGQDVTTQGEDNMINQIEHAHNDGVNPDLIILFMGINDAKNKIPLGTTLTGCDRFLVPIDDPTTITTFTGAVEYCMAKIKYYWIESTVAVLLPLQKEYPVTDYNNMTGSTYDYIEVIKNVSDRFSFPTLDLRKKANFSPNNVLFKNKYCYNSDGLHPNAIFQENKLTPTIYNFLEQI